MFPMLTLQILFQYHFLLISYFLFCKDINDFLKTFQCFVYILCETFHMYLKFITSVLQILVFFRNLQNLMNFSFCQV